MLNSPMLLIFQHFHAIPLRSPLISLRSKWRLTGFSRRFTPKNPVRLHKPFGQLPRWGAKNILPLNLIAFPARKADDTRISSSNMRRSRHLNPSYQSTHSSFLPPSFGRRCPEGAEVGSRYGIFTRGDANPASLRSSAPSRGRSENDS